MKNSISILFLLLFCISLLQAQQTVTPSQINQTLTNSQTLTAQPGKNYIRSYTYRDALDTAYTKLDKTNIDIQYFDGLGRQVETVQLSASPTGKDIIGLQTYDAFGRNNKSYLPLSGASSSSSGGVYVDEASLISSMAAHLGNNFDLIGTDNQFGFSKPDYESSPLNRVLQQGAPGADWQPGTYPTVHPVQYDYQTNTSAVASWKYIGDAFSPISYAANKLYITLTTDEDGKLTRSYTDLEGKVVMKEAYNGYSWQQTRYCYDDFGLLRCVLQPQTSSPAYSDYCFNYKYDSRHRMTYKQVPSGGWVYYVYDNRDRLVLTSDANSRGESPNTDKWFYTKYDALNRPSETGYIIFSAIETISTLQTNYENTNIFYTANSTSIVPQEIMVYDVVPATTPYSDCPFIANTLATTAEHATSTMGLLVAKQSCKIEKGIVPSLTLTDVYYYDKYGRIIQTVKKNHLGYIERISNDYNFAGQIIQTRTSQNYSTTNAYVVDNFYKYDHRGRLIQTDYQVYQIDVNGNHSYEIPRTIVSALVYNEAGHLKTKYLHSQNSLAFLQKIDYRYNIRGWLTGINEPHLASADGDLFGMTLYYNSSSSSLPGYWNGNIKDEKWACGTYLDQVNTYNYDGVNRLTEGLFLNGINVNSFRSTYSYDWNGNIGNLSRWGSRGVLVDQITCGYKVYSNQMDYSNDPYGHVPNQSDFPGTLTGYNHYRYDANGNLTRDDYRYFNVTYNSLNLPSEFDFGGNQKMSYIYDGSGRKLTMIYATGNYWPTNTEYLGQFVHQSCNGTSSLNYIITPEGMLKNKGTNAAPIWEWNYNLTDHLGNVRVVFRPTATNGAEKLGNTNYLPFGLRMPYPYSKGSASNYQYNGKEAQSGFGMELYDFGARFYDPALGRWHSVDPLAEKYYSISPYAYCLNNPVRFTDPDGREVDIEHRKGFLGLGKKETLRYDNGNLYNKDGTAYTGNVNGFLKNTVNAIGSLNKTNEGSSMVTELQSSSNVFTIKSYSENKFIPDNSSKAGANLTDVQGVTGNTARSNGSGGTILWNSNSTSGGLDLSGGTTRPTFVGLGHEMGHGSDSNQGLLNYMKDYTNSVTGAQYQSTYQGLFKSEWRAVYRENIVRGQAGVTLRTNYGYDITTGSPLPIGPRLLDAKNQPLNYP